MNRHIHPMIVALGMLAAAAAPAHDRVTEAQPTIAVDADALGKVSFPVTGSPAVRLRFERALAYLHHMMYELAEQEFSALAKDAPDCAMAYWGIAMSRFHPLWVGQPGKEDYEEGQAAVRAARAIESASPRERAYVEAVAAFYEDWQVRPYGERIAGWARAQQALFEQYPDDLDAATLYALSDLALAPKADRSYRHQKSAGALLERLYRQAPAHPGVLHYTIHAYDNEALAQRAVTAARAYDKIAPDVPHALHMPTHIFVRLGAWPEAIDWNLRSAKAALRYPAGGAVSHHYLHALDYLVYAYLQTAQDRKAASVRDEVLARSNYQRTAVGAYGLAAIPARVALERQDWAAAAALEVPLADGFPWVESPQAEAIIWFARGLGAARNADLQRARDAMLQLDVLQRRLVAADEDYWKVIVDAGRRSVAAWIALGEGDQARALQLMGDAADLEDSMDKHPVTPGAVLPARELLGDMLLLAGRPEQALAAYERALAAAPNRFGSLAGAARAAERSGQAALARSYSSRLLRMCAEADSARPALTGAAALLARK